MTGYLSATELSSLIDCEPNSFSCMRRWLDRGGWPYACNRRGFPQVSREYHDSRMNGVVKASANDSYAEPDFSRFA